MSGDIYDLLSLLIVTQELVCYHTTTGNIAKVTQGNLSYVNVESFYIEIPRIRELHLSSLTFADNLVSFQT